MSRAKCRYINILYMEHLGRIKEVETGFIVYNHGT